MQIRLTGGERTEPAWLYGVAGAVMLGGPIARELYLNFYPARPEAFLLPLMAAALGASVAIGSWWVGGLMASAAFGGLLFGFADIQFDPQRWTYTAAVLAVCIVMAQLLVRHRAAILALALGTFYVTSLARPAIAPPPKQFAASGTARAENPLLVHVVFDGQWGVGGFRAGGDTATAAFLEDFYITRGFELYTSAYSRYHMTVESLLGLVSLGDSAVERLPPREPLIYSLPRNRYFARLHELGYAIRVQQTTYLDFCNSDVAVVSCDTRSSNTIGNIGFLDGGWVNRGILTAQYFLSTRSHVFGRLGFARESWRRALVGAAVAAMREVSASIASDASGGTAWFIHVMTPHSPFQADAECRTQTSPSRYLDYELPANPGDSLWRATMADYADQVRCAHRLLGDVIDAVDSTVGRDRSIIIVHGDHGSRLHPRERHDPKQTLASYSSFELNTHFSTLLAIRRPHVPAMLISEPVPIQGAISHLARSDFDGAIPVTWSHQVRRLLDRPKQGEELRPITVSEMPWARRPD